MGKNVKGFNIGDRVVTNNFYTCGKCFYCRTNRETQCLNLSGILGVLNYNGGFGQFFKIPAKQLFHLPEIIEFTEGAIIADAVVTAVHAIKQARLKPLENVLVMSVGGIGSCIIQICKAYGANVTTVVRSDIKEKRAFEVGSDGVFNSKKIDIASEIKKRFEKGGVDCVFDCVGSEETLKNSLLCCANGGRLIIIGYTQERLQLDPRLVAVHEIEIIGSRCGGRQDTIEAIDFVSKKDWKSVVSDIFPLEKVNDALKFLRDGKALGRIVITY